MDNGNFGVGNKAAPPKPGQPKTPRGLCGAMSQQGGNHGNASAPQKLIQLVGYREAKTLPGLPNPAKR